MHNQEEWQPLKFRNAAIKIENAAINNRECINIYLGMQQLIIGNAAIVNRE
jgi:hypothetical protein